MRKRSEQRQKEAGTGLDFKVYSTGGLFCPRNHFVLVFCLNYTFGQPNVLHQYGSMAKLFNVGLFFFFEKIKK
jgi:hypothetical protein